MYKIAIESSNEEEKLDKIAISFGNPCVEHVTGTVHLFRQSGQAEYVGTATVCVLAIPGDMANAELYTFFGSYMSALVIMRIVRREDVSNPVCMAILEFKEASTSRGFLNHFNGKPFSMLEPEIICRVVAVASIQMETPDPVKPIAAPPGHTELPTCPVCLERLDTHISGVITTVCNHVFHGECLQKWGDSTCPVCRYCFSSEPTSRCETCGTTTNLWICLICGHVGCGRYKEAHARNHFEQTHHCYSLELETGRVWDYVGDGYVHRLIQSSVGGKLVEVPSPEVSSHNPNPHAADGSNPNFNTCCKAESSSHNQSSETAIAMNEEYHMMQATHASKMDAVAREYTHLLTTQLESQRHYYEELRAQDTASHKAQIADLESASKQAADAVNKATARAVEVEAEVKSLQKQVNKMTTKMATKLKEVDVMNELNQSLIANQKSYKEKLSELEAACKEKDATITDLNEQVRDLMVYLEASRMAGSSADLAGGQVQLAPATKNSRKHSKR